MHQKGHPIGMSLYLYRDVLLKCKSIYNALRMESLISFLISSILISFLIDSIISSMLISSLMESTISSTSILSLTESTISSISISSFTASTISSKSSSSFSRSFISFIISFIIWLPAPLLLSYKILPELFLSPASLCLLSSLVEYQPVAGHPSSP